jgi:Fe-S cluster assembly protein SufD
MDSALFLENLTQSFHKQSPYLPGVGRPEIRTIRQHALETACRLNIPSIRLDKWKHARFDTLLETDFMPYLHVPSKQLLRVIESKVDIDEDFVNIVFLNGHFIPSLSHHNHIEIRLQSLARLAKSQPELLADFHKPHSDHFFIELNTAFCSDGAIVIIPEDMHLQKIVVIYHFLINDQDSPGMVHPQTHIRLGKNSEATIIEKTISLGTHSKGLQNCHTELFCSQGAYCHLYRITEHAPSTWGFHHFNATLSSQAQLDLTELAYGAQYQRHELAIHLKGSNAVFNCHGLLLPNTFEHCDWVSHIQHYAEFGNSLQKIKAIIANEGHSSFLGNIAVNQAAQHANTLMINDSLLLGEKGQADSAPQLEILADEVKCNHAATITQLNEQALFYLQSRGIEQNDARKLLLHAFVHEIVQSISQAGLQKAWQEQVYTRLNSLRGA